MHECDKTVLERLKCVCHRSYSHCALMYRLLCVFYIYSPFSVIYAPNIILHVLKVHEACTRDPLRPVFPRGYRLVLILMFILRFLLPYQEYVALGVTETQKQMKTSDLTKQTCCHSLARARLIIHVYFLDVNTALHSIIQAPQDKVLSLHKARGAAQCLFFLEI